LIVGEVAGGAVVVSSAADGGRAPAVARRAVGFSSAAFAAWIVGGAAALAAGRWLEAHLLSVWGVQPNGLAADQLAVGLYPAVACAAAAAVMAALTGRAARRRAQDGNVAAGLARAARVAGLARKLTVAALVALALFSLPDSARLLAQGLAGPGTRDAVAAGWAEAAGAAVLGAAGWLAWWLLGHACAILRTTLGPDGHYWWDGEYWHPLAG
jgi:hypothetical protein